MKTYKDSCQYKFHRNRMLYHALGLSVFSVVIIFLSLFDMIEISKKFGIAVLICGLLLIFCFSGPIIIYNAVKLHRIAKDKYQIKELRIAYIDDGERRKFYISATDDNGENVYITVYKVFLDPSITIAQNSTIKVLYGNDNVLI